MTASPPEWRPSVLEPWEVGYVYRLTGSKANEWMCVYADANKAMWIWRSGHMNSWLWHAPRGNHHPRGGYFERRPFTDEERLFFVTNKISEAASGVARP